MDIQTTQLGRIVAPPSDSGVETDPTYFPPRLYIVGAGATGLAANAADTSSQVALQRNQVSNTGSPNPTSITGSAGSPGLPGAADASTLRPMQLSRAITGPGGQNVSPIAQKRPPWLRPALFVAAGFVVGWMVFK
jgi:hypothetical protein